MCREEEADSHLMHTAVGPLHLSFMERVRSGFPDLVFAWVCFVLILY